MGRLYVGTHRRAQHADHGDIAFGIYSFQVSSVGNLVPDRMTEVLQPGWICVHPSGRTLYAVSEVSEIAGSEGGAVSAFACDHATGVLTKLNQLRLPPMPCHCSVDPSGRFLCIATFAGGTVHLIALRDDGSLGQQVDVHRHSGSSVHPRRQASAHPHAVHFDPSGNFLLVPDLGTDQIVVYGFDPRSGALVPRPDCTGFVSAGSGPRHLAFHSATQSVFLLNEIAARIDAFSFDDRTGRLTPRQACDMLPKDFVGFRSGGEIAADPTGQFLFATTRSRGSSGPQALPGLDTVIWFEIDPRTGVLDFRGRVASGGEIPRSIAFDLYGTRLFVGHQASGTIVTFSIDPTGRVIRKQDEVATPVPVCLLFIP